MCSYRISPLFNAIVRCALTAAIPISLMACSGSSDNSVDGDVTTINTESGSSDGSASASPWVVNGYHLVSSTSYDGNDVVVGSTTYEYDLEKNTVFFSSSGLNFDGGSVTSERIEYYNEHGDVFESLRPNNGGLGINVYSYDGRGLLIKEVNKQESETIYEYNDAGDLIRRKYTNQNFLTVPGYEPSIDTIEYNDRGYRTTSTEVRSAYDTDTTMNEKATTTRTYTYNGLGQLEKMELVDGDSGDSNSEVDLEVYAETYSYDSNGNMTELTSTSTYGFYERSTYLYAKNTEPVFNYWMRRLKYYR